MISNKLQNSLLEKLLKSDKKLYLTITGGGVGVVSKILENGGASSVFLGANIPYNEDDSRAITGSVTKLVSERAAKLLSLDGYFKDSSLRFSNKECICIASTSSLRKNGHERADRVHEAYICVRGYDGKDYNKSVEMYHIVFGEDRTRKQEEDILSGALLAICCSSLTLCKWHLETYDVMKKDIGFTDKDTIEFQKLTLKESRDEEDD
jgi:nicotinamide mononucleotide (NMN) deamidase PncC